MPAQKALSHRQANASFAAALITFVLLSPALAGDRKELDAIAGVSPEKEILNGQGDYSGLQWPLPPAVPRIEMLAEIGGAVRRPPRALSQAPRKLNWKDRLSGVKAVQASAPEPQAKPNRLMQPYGVAADSKGRIYVADSKGHAIVVFDQEGHDVGWYRSGTLMQNVIGLAIDDEDRVFVADADLRIVSVINSAGKLEMNFGWQQLLRPAGVAIDNERRLLYVADTGLDRVAVFDADTFQFVRYTGTAQKPNNLHDAGTLNKPTNLAVGRDGTLYVSDTLNSRIQIFDADGVYVGTIGQPGIEPGTLLRPKGIAVDCDGHIWVADAMQDRVQVFDPEGHLLAYFGEKGPRPGQFILPAGLFIDSRNRVILSEQGNSRVQIFRYISDAEVAARSAVAVVATHTSTGK